eukprot:CAMPEP_0175739944 /NCGR_PEP_ID=MMETSP0097-20121207/55256_1 /TAXON_ID=311494 /ORGANISM="Alexandrium monilatum, Strain CCMP3105" /LENGTH=362 /DNA_ID=CAMNT_0017048205 /DNA_START=28 /DNA_END=1114 /DNA_ORIENTATION=+
MMQPKLPPLVSPKASSVADRIDDENPYDNSWTILKSLKAELRELQATVRAEQHQRETEVNDLRRELKLLQEELAKERAERKAEAKTLSDQASAASNHMLTEFRKMTSVREQQVNELRESLSDEQKARDAGIGNLARKLAEEEDLRSKGVKDLSDLLSDTRRTLDATGMDARQNIYNLVQDMKTLSDHLLRVTNTWQGLKTDTLLSYATTPTACGALPRRLGPHCPSLVPPPSVRAGQPPEEWLSCAWVAAERPESLDASPPRAGLPHAHEAHAPCGVVSSRRFQGSRVGGRASSADAPKHRGMSLHACLHGCIRGPDGRHTVIGRDTPGQPTGNARTRTGCGPREKILCTLAAARRVPACGG